MQTNDDLFDIEIQTEEIESLTRWTQHPAEESKGYGLVEGLYFYIPIDVKSKKTQLIIV